MPHVPLVYCAKCQHIMEPAPIPLMVQEGKILVPGKKKKAPIPCDVFCCDRCGNGVFVGNTHVPFNKLQELGEGLAKGWKRGDTNGGEKKETGGGRLP